MKPISKKPKISVSRRDIIYSPKFTKRIEKEYLEAWSHPSGGRLVLTKRVIVGRIKWFWRGLTNKGEVLVKKIKTTLRKVPSAVSLGLLTAGFIRAGIELAKHESILVLCVILLGLFLARESAKQIK